MEEEAEKMRASLLANWRRDPWELWHGKYADPTDNEYNFVYRYARLFNFEKDDFVFDEKWRSIQEDSGIPNLREVLIDFVHQVRESKGYDVTHRLPLIFDSPFHPITLPMNGDEMYYDQVMEAKDFAISEINNEMKSRGKRYELVSLDKAVWTRHRTYLFTLSVKEKEVDENGEAAEGAGAEGAGETLKTVRAMVFRPLEGCSLEEWKFKP